MSNFDLLDEQQNDIQAAQTLQGSVADAYNIFNMLKTSYGLIGNLAEVTGSLAATLNAVLPIARLALLAIKSAWDLAVLLKTHPGHAQFEVPSNASQLDRALFELVDARKTKANLAKCVFLTVMSVSIVVAALLVPAGAVGFGLAGSLMNSLNEAVNFRFHCVKLAETELLLEEKQAALTATTNPKLRAELRAEIFELNKAQKQQKFEIRDRQVKLAVNALYSAAFVAIAIPGLQVVASAIFLATMVGAFAYYKKGQQKLKQHYGIKESKKPKPSLAKSIRAVSKMWHKGDKKQPAAKPEIEMQLIHRPALVLG